MREAQRMFKKGLGTTNPLEGNLKTSTSFQADGRTLKVVGFLIDPHERD